MIQVQDLTKLYINDDVETSVLRGLAFTIDDGEFVAIMGPSGSGKSTLMHVLAFLDRPTGGSYRFDGKETSGFDDETLARIRNERIGFVFQAFNLLPKTSVFENVRLPLLYRMKYPANADDLVHHAIDSVGLSHRSGALSNQLSGGEKQRVAIARALVNEPELLFADEPTGNLDSASGSQVMEILQHLNDTGKTIILVTHEADTAAHAKRIMKIRDGRIESDEAVAKRRFAKDGLNK